MMMRPLRKIRLGAVTTAVLFTVVSIGCDAADFQIKAKVVLIDQSRPRNNPQRPVFAKENIFTMIRDVTLNVPKGKDCVLPAKGDNVWECVEGTCEEETGIAVIPVSEEFSDVAKLEYYIGDKPSGTEAAICAGQDAVDLGKRFGLVIFSSKKESESGLTDGLRINLFEPVLFSSTKESEPGLTDAISIEMRKPPRVISEETGTVSNVIPKETGKVSNVIPKETGKVSKVIPHVAQPAPAARSSRFESDFEMRYNPHVALPFEVLRKTPSCFGSCYKKKKDKVVYVPLYPFGVWKLGSEGGLAGPVDTEGTFLVKEGSRFVSVLRRGGGLCVSVLPYKGGLNTELYVKITRVKSQKKALTCAAVIIPDETGKLRKPLFGSPRFVFANVAFKLKDGVIGKRIETTEGKTAESDL